jgi:TFIIF-interacting CTD phosphatase-like protein
MDPKKKYFKYRLYRNNCSLLDVEGAKFYVKDLEILNEHYNLKDIVIIDNSVLSFAFHLHNGIPIVPYYDEDKDGSLYVVGLYLMHIYNEEDLREANKKHINLDSFLEEAKRKKEESISSEVEDDESYDNEENEDDVIIDINNSQNIPESKSDKTNNTFKFIKRSSLKDNSKNFSDKKVIFNLKKRNQFLNFRLCYKGKKAQILQKIN